MQECCFRIVPPLLRLGGFRGISQKREDLLSVRGFNLSTAQKKKDCENVSRRLKTEPFQMIYFGDSAHEK